MSIGDSISIFYYPKPIIFERGKAIIQQAKVAFRKSPLEPVPIFYREDLGVKTKDVEGNTNEAIIKLIENDDVAMGFTDLQFQLAIKNEIINR